ncbi:MAG: choice-of-anchor D domain-containing protein, partial [Calditrichaeota bacterium]|nr:choice-of-anchor D domain-containing protein [Calditrichota bacterium]
MKKSILEISVSIFVLVLAVTPNVMAQQHFDWVQTDANMSVLITGATIDDETVVVDDEIGIFTPGGLCAGGAVVPDDFPDERLGCAAFGAEQGQANGFQVEEEISFRIWDHGADFEVIADIQVGNEAEPIFEPNGFIVLSLSAESPGAHFVWDVTDTNMSILITSATIAGESLSEGDEVAAFTEEGVCGGGGVVPDDFPDQPMGIALFGSEPEQDNGFQADEEIEFRLWDHMVGAEVLARMNIIRGEANYVTNGLLIVALAGDAPPELILSDDAHDFEVVNIGESADWAFTVTNDGEHDLVVSNMESTVDYFTVDFEEETTFEPGSSAEYTVTFAPNAEGDLLGALRIFSNDPNDEIISISLIGAGYRVIPPTIVLSIEGMEYGNVPVGDERSQSMTISNEGDEPLLIPAIVIDNEGFSSDLEGEIEILSGESMEITFTFHPQESSDLAIEAIIQSNDPENPEVGFSLVGNGFVAGEDHHFEFVTTDNSMSVVVNEALLDGEPLAINDEVGVFTPGGLCAGSGFVTDRGLGIAAWGADQQGQVAGFQDGEVLTFVYFIHQIDQEFLAIAEVIEGNLNWERDELAIIELSGLTVPPDVFVEENEHDFGMVRVGRNSQWTFTVENRSEGDLLVSNVEIDGEYYEVDFQDMVVIEFQESHDFTVTFTPEDEGEFNTTLRIVSNDPDEHILEISILAGAEIILPPTIALSTDLIDFERISIEEVAELPLRITNEGDELLVIEAIDLARGVFAVDPDDEIEIPGGEFVDLTVSFEPEDVDDYVSEMVVRSNDQENGELVVTLWGSGFDPNQAHYVWEQTDSNLSILILAATLNGETLVENDEVGVFNEAGLCAGGGEVPANFPDEPMGIAAFGAEQEMDNGFTANEAISFQIWDFAADFEVDAEAQGVNGDVVFVANGFLVVNISAEGQQGGVRPVIGLSDENHNFDEVRPGSSRDWEFSVRNSGRATLVVTDVTTEGDRFSVEFGGDVELEFGEEYSYTVTFSPEEVGEYEGVVYVTSNDPIDEIVEISLIGFCEEAPAPPSIAVEPGALDFGRTVVGEQSTLPVEISNAGEEPLIVTGIDFAGDMFSSNFNREIEIAEGGVAEVLITFEPAEGGEQEGIATILSNDQENPEIQVALVGLGFAPGEIAHYEWDNTDANMSILVVSATLDGELLVQFDEVGVFTQGDLCAGGGPIPEAFPDEALGMSAWGTEQGEENGFEVGEDLNFRVWDHMAEVEADADLSVINGVAPVYQANGFIVVELEAHSRATPNMVIDEEPYNFGLVPVGESAEWDVVIENT